MPKRIHSLKLLNAHLRPDACGCCRKSLGRLGQSLHKRTSLLLRLIFQVVEWSRTFVEYSIRAFVQLFLESKKKVPEMTRSPTLVVFGHCKHLIRSDGCAISSSDGQAKASLERPRKQSSDVRARLVFHLMPKSDAYLKLSEAYSIFDSVERLKNPTDILRTPEQNCKTPVEPTLIAQAEHRSDVYVEPKSDTHLSIVIEADEVELATQAVRYVPPVEVLPQLGERRVEQAPRPHHSCEVGDTDNRLLPATMSALFGDCSVSKRTRSERTGNERNYVVLDLPIRISIDRSLEAEPRRTGAKLAGNGRCYYGVVAAPC